MLSLIVLFQSYYIEFYRATARRFLQDYIDYSGKLNITLVQEFSQEQNQVNNGKMFTCTIECFVAGKYQLYQQAQHNSETVAFVIALKQLTDLLSVSAI